MKLTQLMNEGEEKRPLSNEVKKHFLEIVSTYNKYQESLDRKSDIQEIAETLGGITEAARTLAIHEGDDWFDKHTIKRNMSELEKLGKEFDKCAVEAKSLDQRLGGLYEDMGNILSRYYKMGDITEDQMKERLGMTNESVNEANSRDEYDAKEFWGDSKMGIQLHKQFKGRFNKSKFEKALSDLIGKSKRPESTIKIIGRNLNLPLSQLNSYTSGEIIEDQEFIKDSTKKAEQLYKIFVSLKESVNESKSSCGCGCGGVTEGGCSTSVNEEKPGLWANIRAKKARGEKPAHKNSQAHKDAVKAGKKINKEESVVREAKFGYKDSTASYINNHKDEYKQAEKLNKGNEVKFYDTLSQMEDKIGHPKFMIFLSNALRGYKVDMYKDPKIKNPQDAQEALYLLSK